ncbi:MAG TPA: response regulator [Ktedonobacterales bacterium]|nr:response regulator [Ktedonobacterales bacterium]
MESRTDDGSPRPYRVLVVDDNLDLLAAVRFALLGEFEVETVTSAEDALEHLDHLSGPDRPDCLVVDVRMPGLNGVQLVRILRGDPETAQIPLIILSAYAQDEDVLRGMFAGVDQYLAKPFNLETLVAAIHWAVRQSPEERMARLRDLADREGGF